MNHEETIPDEEATDERYGARLSHLLAEELRAFQLPGTFGPWESHPR